MASATATGGDGPEQTEGARAMPTGPLAATPSTTPQEGAMVSGSPPFWYGYIYMHWVFMTTFAWSSDMKPGTILWKVPLSPLFMNWVIRYFTKIHNLWQGSFDFELWMAGTGFNGGKLVMFWAPPNYDISTFNLQDATTFAHVEIDPKLNEAIPICGKDFCLQKAHVVRISNELPDEMADDLITQYAKIGGWIGLMVMNPLINASETKTSVNISIMNKAGADFRLFQVVPIPKKLSPKSNYDTLYFSEDERALDFPSLSITHLNVSTKVATTGIDTGLLIDIPSGGYSRFDGIKRIYDINVPFDDDLMTTAESNTRVGNHYDAPLASPPFAGVRSLNTLAFVSVDFQGTGQISVFDGTDYFKGIGLYNTGDKSCTYAAQVTVSGFTGNSDWSYFCLYGRPVEDHDTKTYCKIPFFPANLTPIPDQYEVLSKLDESVVTFGTANCADGAGYALPVSLHYFFFGHVNEWQAGRNPVFQLVDKTTKLGVLNLRLHHEGFFTTNRVKNIVRIELKDNYLKFLYYLDENTPLPAVTPTARAYLELKGKLNMIEVVSEKLEALVDLYQPPARNEEREPPSYSEDEEADSDDTNTKIWTRLKDFMKSQHESTSDRRSRQASRHTTQEPTLRRTQSQEEELFPSMEE